MNTRTCSSESPWARTVSTTVWALAAESVSSPSVSTTTALMRSGLAVLRTASKPWIVAS